VQLLFSRFEMTRIVFFITILCLSLVGMTQTPVFASDSPYSVTGVDVDVLDESSVKARNKAFLDAKRKAFEVLATRYYSEEELKVMKTPSDDVISGFIQDFKIASEQVSTKRYKGVFDFRFKSSEVNKHFGRGPINFVGDTTDKQKKALLVPFYHEEKKAVVFNLEQNPFWGSLLVDLPKFPDIILPEGNIQDLTDIGTRNPTFMTPVTIRKLKARYNVNTILIAIAHINLNDQSLINVELLDVSGEEVTPLVSFNENPKLIANSTLLGASEFIKPKKTTPLINEEEVSQPKEGEILESEIDPKLFDPMGRRGSGSYVGRDKMIKMAQDRSREERKKRETAIAKQQQMNEQLPEEEQAISGEISVQIFFNTISEWVTTQKEISRLDGLQGIRIVTLKTNQAETVVEYNDWNKLIQSIKSSGYVLYPQSENSYLLKRLSDNF
jgi:hypothetical protein